MLHIFIFLKKKVGISICNAKSTHINQFFGYNLLNEFDIVEIFMQHTPKILVTY